MKILIKINSCIYYNNTWKWHPDHHHTCHIPGGRRGDSVDLNIRKLLPIFRCVCKMPSEASKALYIWQKCPRCVCETHIEQKTIFRQRNHISPHFTKIIFSVLKKFLFISLKMVKKSSEFIAIKGRNLFLWKMKKLDEIQNKWRSIVTWRNMVLCSICPAATKSTGVNRINVWMSFGVYLDQKPTSILLLNNLKRVF